jgi:hypothetical protein
MFSETEVSFWKIRMLRIKKSTLNYVCKIRSEYQIFVQFSNHKQNPTMIRVVETT